MRAALGVERGCEMIKLWVFLGDNPCALPIKPFL